MSKVEQLTSTAAALRLPFLSAKLMDNDGSVTPAQQRRWMKLAFLYVFVQQWRMSLWLGVFFFLFIIGLFAPLEVSSFGISSLWSLPFLLTMARMAMVVIVLGLLLAAPVSTMACSPASYVVFPEAVYMTEQGLAFAQNKGVLPWGEIKFIQTKELIYRGLRKTPVVEFYIDARTFDKFKLVTLKKDNFYHFFDQKRNDLVKDDYDCVCVRLPIALFGFEADRQKFVQTLVQHLPPEVIHSLPETESAATMESDDTFTAMWLTELREPQNISTQRLLEVGRSLQNGRYQISEVLGYGGFSVVYGAVQTAAPPPASETTSQPAEHQRVAIKEIVLNTGGTRASKEKMIKHIVSEIQILQGLDHPSIVKCLDFFIEDGRIYLVMQALEGLNLRQFVQANGPLSESDLIEVGQQCCTILAYLHGRAKPIMHRDFTPDNLIWDGKTVKLIDFNVAEEANTCSSQTVVGKHCYLAPEQWCGDFSVAGDLYQFGCTLYYLAAGQDPEPLTQSNPCTKRSSLSADLGALVSKLTERHPENRLASASQASNQLQAISEAPV